MNTSEEDIALSRVFEHGNIGPLRLKNRVIRAGAMEGMCPDNLPDEDLLSHHLNIAASGIAMTTIGCASVTQRGLASTHQLWIQPRVLPELTQLAEEIHQEGTAISIQLSHLGNMANSSMATQMPVSASANFQLIPPTIALRMRRKEITATIKAFGEATRVAATAGFDAVEVQAGHGHLINQFLCPATNRRHDEYGGNFERRARFLTLVLNEVMEAAAGRLAVLVKLNMSDGFPGGMEREECLQVARLVEAAGVHAIIPSGGFLSRCPQHIVRGFFPERTFRHYMESRSEAFLFRLFGKRYVQSLPFRKLYFLEEALEFRRHLHLPLVYIGGVTSSHDIEHVLSLGFDFVAMARAFINDPRWFTIVRQRHPYQSPCSHDNYCLARTYSRETACFQRLIGTHKTIFQEIQSANHKYRNTIRP